MKHALLLIAIVSAPAFADWSNPLETNEQARQRQSAENYDTYHSRQDRILPPTYERPLGDHMQRGVDRPGYAPVYQPRDFLRD